MIGQTLAARGPMPSKLIRHRHVGGHPDGAPRHQRQRCCRGLQGAAPRSSRAGSGSTKSNPRSSQRSGRSPHQDRALGSQFAEGRTTKGLLTTGRRDVDQAITALAVKMAELFAVSTAALAGVLGPVVVVLPRPARPPIRSRRSAMPAHSDRRGSWADALHHRRDSTHRDGAGRARAAPLQSAAGAECLTVHRGRRPAHAVLGASPTTAWCRSICWRSRSDR